MKPDQMAPATREAIANLPREAKRDLMTWFRSRITVLAGSAELEAKDMRFGHLIRGYANMRKRTADIAIEELQEILGPMAEHNAHLGATKE